MITVLFIAGALLLFVAAGFYWLNMNTPIQTPIPAIAGGLGIVAILLAFGGVLL